MAGYVPARKVIIKEVPIRDYPHEEGDLVLSPGRSQIEISTEKPCSRVWVAMEQSGHLPVCYGDLDTVSVSIIEFGFILYADIKSSGRRVSWLAEM